MIPSSTNEIPAAGWPAKAASAAKEAKPATARAIHWQVMESSSDVGLRSA